VSFGLPAHLVREVSARAAARSTQGFAFVCLAAAVVTAIVVALEARGALSWLALPLLVATAGLLWWQSNRFGVALGVAYLIVGGAGTFVYVLALFHDSASYHDTDLFVFALPVAALIMVAGSRFGHLDAVLWATAGYVIGEGAIFLAAIVAGRQFGLDPIPFTAYVLVIGSLSFNALTRTARRPGQAEILRALREEQLTSIRRELIADAAGELHDTMLGQLAVLANSRPGPLDGAFRLQLREDLARWGRDRAEELADPIDWSGGVEWRDSDLAVAIDEARETGLDIDVSGDLSLVARLSPARGRALGLAVRQILANVLRHSGELAAEVVLSGSDSELSVMVVDGGRGFDASGTATDRMGLRRSVRDRIERVGGTTAIFSRPGAGTSVLLLVPIGLPDFQPPEAGADGGLTDPGTNNPRGRP
jgi:signal transduction histidine kinase